MNSLDILKEESFLYESTEEFLLDEGAVKDFVDRQIDKINGLTKIGLKREDLYDPAKVKAAIKKMDSLKDQNRNVIIKAIIALFLTFLTYIVGVFVIFKGSDAVYMDNIRGGINKSFGTDLPTDEHKKWDKAYVGVMGSFIAIITGEAIFLKTDYERIMGAFDKNINKIDKLIKKENKKEVPNKDYIKDLEGKKKKLIEGKTAVYEKYKKEAAELNNVKEL